MPVKTKWQFNVPLSITTLLLYRVFYCHGNPPTRHHHPNLAPATPPPPRHIPSLFQLTSRDQASVLMGQGAPERETDTQEGTAVIGS